jgi:ABC-type branched-subunit amino acid transport system substrate-binding protein
MIGAAASMAVLLGGLTGAGAAGAAVSAKSTAACVTPQPVTPAEASSTTGITPNSVSVGNVSIISGPVPGLFEGAPNGVKAYFAYVNSKGGVYGRKLKVSSFDDAFSGSANRAYTQQAIAQDFAMVGNFSLFDSEGCQPLAVNPAVPDVSVTLDPGTNALPNDFSAQPLSQGLSLGPLAYFRHHYPKDTKVGTVVSNAATALAQWQGEQAGLQHAGYKIAYVDKVSPLQTDYTTDVINMRNDGVNVLYMTALDWQVGALIMKAAYQQNWHPALAFSGGPLYADQFISAAGGPTVANGIWIGQGQALYLGQDSAHVPAVKQFNTWVKKVAPSWTPDLFTLYGWASAEMFVQALQAAGPHPTRGAVLAQLKKITAYNANGLLGTANPAAKTPSACYIIAHIENGKYKRVYPAKSGFACSSKFFYAAG